MMMFEVIKNAGIPNNWAKYPFDELEVGDGFDAPHSLRNKLASAACVMARRRGGSVKFTIRKLDENTVRCIRTA